MAEIIYINKVAPADAKEVAIQLQRMGLLSRDNAVALSAVRQMIDEFGWLGYEVAKHDQG